MKGLIKCTSRGRMLMLMWATSEIPVLIKLAKITTEMMVEAKLHPHGLLLNHFHYCWLLPPDSSLFN